MKAELYELVKLFEKKHHPLDEYDSNPKLIIYGDGSGFIQHGVTVPFSFYNISELVDYLEGKEIQPWY